MKYFTRIGDDEREFRFERHGSRLIAHVAGAGSHELDRSLIGDGTAFSLLVDGESHDVVVERIEGGLMAVQFRGERVVVDVADERERMAREVHAVTAGGVQQVCAVMPGVVVEVRVAEGDEVTAGQTLVVLEAMKMQNPLLAEADGVVTRVLVGVGNAVAGGALLLEVDRG